MNIIVQLQGGLGNQLFQYATARALTKQKQATLLLDQSWYTQTYEDVTPRELLLNELNIEGTLISLLPRMKRPKRIRLFAQNFLPINPFIFAEKTAYQFDFRLDKSPKFRQQNLYLIGYWQSYKYFENIKSVLQREISPKKPLNIHYQKYLQKIQSSQSAMVHVRRGDYVTLDAAAKVHGFVGLEYYKRGMASMLARNSNMQFFIFSDDIPWAKQNLPYPEKSTYIDSINANDDAVQELELMTYCQHHLIANSSLSWWAAWLSKNPNSLVLCPKKWMNDPNLNVGDLLPPAWERL